MVNQVGPPLAWWAQCGCLVWTAARPAAVPPAVGAPSGRLPDQATAVVHSRSGMICLKQVGGNEIN